MYDLKIRSEGRHIVCYDQHLIIYLALHINPEVTNVLYYDIKKLTEEEYIQ